MKKLRSRRRSPHQLIEVFDETADGRRVRRLFLDSLEQSAIDLDHPARPVWVYTDFVRLAWVFRTAPKKVLVLGLGGGVMPRSLAADRPRPEIDVVELDPGVVSAARRWFGVEEGPKLRIHTEDARRYLARTGRVFDLVVLDVFRRAAGDLRTPAALLSAGFFETVRSRLSRDGVLVFNLVGRLSGRAGATLAVVRRLKAAFPQVYLFPIFLKKAPDLSEERNIMVVCTMSRKRLGAGAVLRRARRLAAGGPPAFRRLPEYAENYLDPSAGRAGARRPDPAAAEGAVRGSWRRS